MTMIAIELPLGQAAAGALQRARGQLEDTRAELDGGWSRLASHWEGSSKADVERRTRSALARLLLLSDLSGELGDEE